MKQKLLSFLLPIAVLLFTACKKSDDSNSGSGISNTPTAKAEYDNSNFGIYKGVFVGSSGTVIINVNNDNAVAATLKVDGTTYNFITSQTIQQNQATSINFVSGTNSFKFTSDANGANPAVTNLVFTGHPNAAISVMKETSTSLVRLFEGTYKENAVGGETGVWNMIVNTSAVSGEAIDGLGQYPHYPIAGYVSNNQITAFSPAPTNVPPGAPTGTNVTGTISGNNISGTFNNAYGGGTWTGTQK